MATLTRNLFRGHGEGDWRLDVVEGHWPSDAHGEVFVIGPDKREPGGHWFGEWGLLHRIACTPGADGRVAVRSRRVHTRLERLSQRMPRLFHKMAFAEVSPFGVSNLANTNVMGIDGRLFLGYDAGRPVEVDPVTMDAVTPVGSNKEWIQSSPGLLEPMTMVAAHPAPAFDEHALYFVNYSTVPTTQLSVGRWALNGPVERWNITTDVPFDSIHDCKATRNHLVISDLPFKVDPEEMRTGRRTTPNQDVTNLWIVAKADLRTTPPGGTVPVTEVQLPYPSGHLSVDVDDADGVVRVHLEHAPLFDLMMTMREGDAVHGSDETVGLEHEGLVCISLQPGAVGTYRIDAATGEVLDSDVVWDDRFWGPLLSTHDEFSPAAREQVDDIWMAGMGFDPALVPQAWWDLYGESGLHSFVAPEDLPVSPRPGAVAHFDVANHKLAAVWEYPAGAFPSPPQYVPRRGSTNPGDGYVMVLVHADDGKEVHLFDAQHVDAGPVARARLDSFNPPLLLHSYWMPSRQGPRPSTYSVPLRDDVSGAVRAMPGLMKDWMKAGRAMAAEAKAAHRAK
jgi:carotenoid cleavage dioxygenase-like enzyme